MRLTSAVFAVLSGCGRIAFDPGHAATSDAAPADAAMCPLIDDHFDQPSLSAEWTPFASNGAPMPTVSNGSAVLDIVNAPSLSDIGSAKYDLREAVMTVTVRDFTFVAETQVFLELTCSTRQFAMLAIDPALMVARIENGTSFDDASMGIATPAAFRLRLATRPASASETEITWSYALAETGGFVEMRRFTTADDLSAASIGIAYQAYATPPSDPPPIVVDDVLIEQPCP